MPQKAQIRLLPQAEMGFKITDFRTQRCVGLRKFKSGNANLINLSNMKYFSVKKLI